MEHFYTIQGEGKNTGKPCYFIRLAGCNVGCHWCDVKESWEIEENQYLSIENILSFVDEYNAKRVVVTGGEPTMYNLKPLTDLLIAKGIETYIETSGAFPITGTWHWICLSPKKFKFPLKENYKKANELKVVVSNKHDLDWGKKLAENTESKCELYFQPEWSKEGEVLPMIINYVKQNQDWKISLQTHKYMNIP